MNNRILGSLARQDYAQFAGHLETCELPARKQLEAPNRKVTHVYFIERGIAAVWSISNKQRAAVALVGYEGATGISIFLGDNQSPHSTVMLCDGTAQRISVEAIRGLMDRLPQARRLLLRYCAVFHNQAAHTALSNNFSLVEQRLARWVLMAHDRMPSNTIPLTHQAVAEILGVRRAGITDALDRLQNLGMVRLERGATVLLDRGAMEGIAGQYYGLPEAEYARLIGTYWPPVRRNRNSN